MLKAIWQKISTLNHYFEEKYINSHSKGYNLHVIYVAVLVKV